MSPDFQKEPSILLKKCSCGRMVWPDAPDKCPHDGVPLPAADAPKEPGKRELDERRKKSLTD